MKKVFVILALLAMAGCSNMHWPGRSSSGGTSSSTIGSSGMEMGSGYSSSSSRSSSITAMPGSDAYLDYTRGTYNPATGLPVPAGP